MTLKMWLLKCRVHGEITYVGKTKTNFCYKFNIYKRKHRAFRKGNQNIPLKSFHCHDFFDGCNEIDDWDFVNFDSKWKGEKRIQVEPYE